MAFLFLSLSTNICLSFDLSLYTGLAFSPVIFSNNSEHQAGPKFWLKVAPAHYALLCTSLTPIYLFATIKFASNANTQPVTCMRNAKRTQEGLRGDGKKLD